MTEQAQQIIHAGSNRLSGIIGAYTRYVVPPYQRDYSWGKAECEALLSDILDSAASKSPHFLGQIVLRPVEHNLYELIDGQQRLTTMLLFTLAVAFRLKEAAKSGQDPDFFGFHFRHCLNRLHTMFVDSAQRPLRVTLGYKNDRYFEKLIRSLKISKPTEHKTTNGRIYEALRFFEKALIGIDSYELADLIDEIYEQLYFNVINVNSWQAAVTVFGSINSEDAQQQVADLVKNLLIDKMVYGSTDRDEIENVRSRMELYWSGILDKITPGEVSNFLRCVELLNANGNTIRMKDLLACVSDRISSKRAAASYLKELKKYAGMYSAIAGVGNDNSEHLGKNFSSAKETFEAMKRFSIRLPISLLLAVAERFSAEEFRRFAQDILTLSIRFNVVCGLPTRDLETAYSTLTKRIVDGKVGTAEAIRTLAKDHDPDNKTFKEQFRDMTAHKHKAVYFLSEIEAHVAQRPSNKVELDKIIPADTNGYWTKRVDTSTLTDLNDSLANYFLVESGATNGSTGTFEMFRKRNATSAFSINRKIASKDKWDKAAITAHRRWLANKANEIWNLEVR